MGPKLCETYNAMTTIPTYGWGLSKVRGRPPPMSPLLIYTSLPSVLGVLVCYLVSVVKQEKR